MTDADVIGKTTRGVPAMDIGEKIALFFTGGIITYAIGSMIISFVAVIITVIVKPLVKSLKEKKRAIIASKSELYKELLEANPLFEFKPLREFYLYTVKCNSKRMFDDFDFDTCFSELCYKNKKLFRTYAADAKYNKELFEDYISYFNSIKKSAEQSKLGRRYRSAEMALLEKTKLTPATTTKIRISAEYSTPKKKISNSAFKDYDISEVESAIEARQARIDRITNLRAQIEHERSIMNEKLRYQVLRRDGFRCVICGASAADGVQLHVDHIKPVSKGGKTEMSNLRTLCERCNLGKGDSYIEGEIN